MRILAAIPHYFDAQGTGKHGSLRPNPGPRIAGLVSTLAGLRQFSQSYMLSLVEGAPTAPIEQSTITKVDIIICTTGERHLLAQLPFADKDFIHRATQVHPRLLGFECQLALREQADRYDYYCYLEDDIIIRDPWHFTKLAWFTKLAGWDAVLQPNRYELELGSRINKLYVDGDLSTQASELFQNFNDRPQVTAEVLGTPVSFRRPLNPHAGCFFLDAAQFSHWTRQSTFGKQDTRFIGALESAATLGVMATFRLYKAVAPNMAFLEIQHSGSEILSSVERASAAPQVPKNGHTSVDRQSP